MTSKIDDDRETVEKSDEFMVTVSLTMLDELRRQAGRAIDPKTAEAFSTFRQVIDPYNDLSEFTEETYCIGRFWFFKNPDSNVWIWEHDIPNEITDAVGRRLQDEPDEDDLPF